jgi:hypothetical protein
MLCKYLRRCPNPLLDLDANQFDQLAGLIERFVQKRGKGKRYGGTIPTPHGDAQERLLALARSFLRPIQRRRGRVPHGGIRKAVEQAGSYLAEDDGIWQFNIEAAIETIRREGVSPRRGEVLGTQRPRDLRP